MSKYHPPLFFNWRLFLLPKSAWRSKGQFKEHLRVTRQAFSSTTNISVNITRSVSGMSLQQGRSLLFPALSCEHSNKEAGAACGCSAGREMQTGKCPLPGKCSLTERCSLQNSEKLSPENRRGGGPSALTAVHQRCVCLRRRSSSGSASLPGGTCCCEMVRMTQSDVGDAESICPSGHPWTWEVPLHDI